MTFVYGFLGAVLCVSLLACGAVVGWKAHEHFSTPKIDPISELERKQIDERNRENEETQKAWRRIETYSERDAYGINDVEEEGRI